MGDSHLKGLTRKMAEGKQHMSIVICGHVDSGKSTTTGRLLFELGGVPEREMQKLKEEAEKLGKGSFAFAFYMDTQKDERERGVTIKCTTKEFFTDLYHYSIKCGYSPIGHVRCGRAACRLVKINWGMGKATGGEKSEGVTELKTNDAAEGIFVPQQPLVVD